MKGHEESRCWKIHPELQPSKSKEQQGTTKGKEAKPATSEKKSWKVKFAELEAKMEAMSANATNANVKPQVTPSFYTRGGSKPYEGEFEDYMLSGMALATLENPMEAYVITRSQTPASKEVPRGASLQFDPQYGKDFRQARLPQSFILEEMAPTSSMVPPSRAVAPLSRNKEGFERLDNNEAIIEVANTI